MEVENKNKRETGIELLGAVPWGAHICLLYNSKQDFSAITVPYLRAGLSNNEFCLWITSGSTGVKEAATLISGENPPSPDSPENKQIEIVAFTDACLKDGKFDLKTFHQTLINRVRYAGSAGYDGLRVVFDISWAKRAEWQRFARFAAMTPQDNGQSHMLGFCAYPLDKCGAEELIGLIGTDKYTLVANDGKITHPGDFRFLASREALNKIQKRYQSQLQKARKELRESQEKFFKALRISPGIVSIATLDDGKFIEVNDEFCRGSGYRREEVIGHNALELKFWPDPKARARMVEKLKKRRRIQNEEAVINIKSGEKRIVIYSNELITINDRPCILSVMNDVTEKRRLYEKEQAIISTAMDGFWIADIDGKFLEVNDSYCRMIGYTREELLKMAIKDIEAMERPEDIANRINKIIRQGSDRFQTRHRRKDGGIIDIEINASFYNIGKGQIFTFIHDLSREKDVADSGETRIQTFWRKNMTRLQEKFVREGFQNFKDREIIELLLSLVTPARQARQLAVKCIGKFTNLAAFLAASPEELIEIGVTPACVFCIAMLHKLPIKVLQEKIREKSIYESPQDIFDYLYYSMRDLKKEVFKAICLDARSHIIDIVDLFEGDTNRIAISAREIIVGAIANKTRSLIFVHNHPSGDPAPSQSDKRLTRDLVFVSDILQIRVLDHIIIGENKYFSFAQETLIEEYELDFLNLKLTGTSESRKRRIRKRFPFSTVQKA
jgi:DNA repair protein RadC